MVNSWFTKIYSLITVIFQSITLVTSQHFVNLVCVNEIYLSKKIMSWCDGINPIWIWRWQRKDCQMWFKLQGGQCNIWSYWCDPVYSKIRKLSSGYFLGPHQLPIKWVSEVNQLKHEATTHFHLVLGLTLSTGIKCHHLNGMPDIMLKGVKMWSYIGHTSPPPNTSLWLWCLILRW